MSRNDKDPLTNNTYRKVHDDTKKAGSTNFRAKEREEAGLGLNEMVDPSKNGLIRRSLNSMEKLTNGLFQLVRGAAMAVENRFDTTGSMERNVSLFFDCLPRTYSLLKKVLKRYDLQLLNSTFGDHVDSYILCRSQFEMGEKIPEQMTMLIAEGNGGGNGGEDSQYGLFAGAYLTSAHINRYKGMKYYDFTTTDEPSHNTLDKANLERVFGETVMEKVNENGNEMSFKRLPDAKKIVDDLLKRAHAFLFIVVHRDDAEKYWPNVFPAERIIHVNDTHLMPEFQASIIGLTEGVLTLKTLEDFLMKEANLSAEDAKMIKRAVSGIPLGVQAQAEDFNNIPQKNDLFKEKLDLFPLSEVEIAEYEEAELLQVNEEGNWM